MKIVLSGHAREKLEILRDHGVIITEEFVREALAHPDKVVRGSSSRLIAQKGLDETHILRVVFIRQADRIRVVTLYPARRERY